MSFGIRRWVAGWLSLGFALATVDLCGETGDRDTVQARGEERFGVAEECVKRPGDRPLNSAARATRAGDVDAAQETLPERGVHVAQGDLGGVAGERPPAAGPP